MIITRCCPLCGSLSFVMCVKSAWEAYQGGMLAQKAFPKMDSTTRETIISGVCLPCQVQFFSDDDEDECDGECDVCANSDCPSNISLFMP